MPKPIKIVVEVEELAFGRVFRTLDNMQGVASITIVSEGGKTPGSPKSSTERQKRGGATTLSCIILSDLMTGSAKDAEWLRQTAVKSGKAASSVPDSLNKLLKAKEIKRMKIEGHVVYAITAKGKARYETACQIQKPTE